MYNPNKDYLPPYFKYKQLYLDLKGETYGTNQPRPRLSQSRPSIFNTTPNLEHFNDLLRNPNPLRGNPYSTPQPQPHRTSTNTPNNRSFNAPASSLRGWQNRGTTRDTTATAPSSLRTSTSSSNFDEGNSSGSSL